MEVTQCAQCGQEIESKGIHFRGRIFCGDECCEEFEAAFVDKSEPGQAELDDGLDDDLDDEEIDAAGLINSDPDDDSGKKDYDDDDFAIEPDDF